MTALRAAIAHGGGPTAVLNASLAGVVEASRGRFLTLAAARYGLHGFLRGETADLLALPQSRIDEIAAVPGSAIGSSRRELTPEQLDHLLRYFRREEIGVFFYTGGNGSMATAMRIEQAARAIQMDLRVIGVPKTIDNDLHGSDHTPGYGSTAYFFACAARDCGIDNRSLPSPVCVLETLGRNSGWIVAATALARHHEDDAPHVILFPERRISLDRIAAQVASVCARLGRCVIAVCEGQTDENGDPFGAHVDRADSPHHRLASNLGHTLAGLLTAKLGIRARAEKPGLIARSCGMIRHETDHAEAYACGRFAAELALAGRTGVLPAMERIAGDAYAVRTVPCPLMTAASGERLLPDRFIAASGMDVTPEFLNWARPLVGTPRSWGDMLTAPVLVR